LNGKHKLKKSFVKLTKNRFQKLLKQ